MVWVSCLVLLPTVTDCHVQSAVRCCVFFPNPWRAGFSLDRVPMCHCVVWGASCRRYGDGGKKEKADVVYRRLRRKLTVAAKALQRIYRQHVGA